MTGFESVVGINPWTALFTFCNMIITFLVLKKFFFKPLKKMIDDRQAEVDTMYADAETAKSSAAALEQEYTQRLRQANTEASAIISQAADDARAKGDTILREAKVQAAEMKEKAEADIRLERKKAVNQLKDELSDMAVAIAARVTEKELKPEDHTALVEQFISDLEAGQ